MRKVDIRDRKNRVLFAIVESYIETASPVGSRLLSQKFRWSMSPATIRNVMADLEEDGYIMQPHTSAGRVPTDKGYKFYIESLLEPRRLTNEEESVIYKMVCKAGADIDIIMHNAAKVISIITNVAGIVLTPQLKRSVFKHIEFIPIDASHAIAVLITRSGIIKSYMLDLGMEISALELVRISEFLNHELENMLLGDIRQHLTRRLLEESNSFYAFLKKAVDIISRPNLFRAEDNLYCDGIACVMSHPEFRDIQKARMFLKVFEDKQALVNLLYEDMEREYEGVRIHIGKENCLKDIDDMGIVTCNYRAGGNVLGAVAAIGPMRMEYSKAIAAVRYVASLLGKVLEGIG